MDPRDTNLLREGARGGELFADEIASSDVWDAEQVTEAAGVGAFADAGAAQEYPLDNPNLAPPPLADNPISHHRSPTTPSHTTTH